MKEPWSAKERAARIRLPRSNRWPISSFRKGVSKSAVMLFGDLSQFYERLGMKRKAIGYSDSAMSASRRLSGMLMPDLWRFRTQIFANSSRPGEAF